MPRKAKTGDSIGNYRIDKEINAGAMAIAYKATSGGETVFFKQYKSPTPTVSWYSKYVEYQKELKRRVEGTNAKNFSYRFIEFFEASFGGKNFFQVFEWVEGGKDLEHFLQDSRVPGKVTWEQRLTLARVMMAGINALHEAGIVHCDLKPPNIVLFEDRDIAAGYRLKVIDMDFSILKDQAAPWHGTDTGYVGTPLYFSPEHLQKGYAPVQASDIFTCGLILYELLAGSHPYPDEATYTDSALNWKASPPRMLGEISGAAGAQDIAARLLHQCLCPDASKRPSAKDVNLALRGKYEGAAPVAPPEASAPPVAPPITDPPSAAPSPAKPPPPPPLPPAEEKRAGVRLELVHESGKTLMCGIRTDVGKHICGQMGEEAKFMTDVQFTVEPNTEGTEWVLTHRPDAKNQTLVNGVFSAGPTTLKEGDVVGVGNAAKGIVKLPMTVRLVRGS
jgi:eukaryotic-like serine/threonine-protein kinase